MNLLVKKTGLILGLALFLFACEEPGEIGIQLSPDTGDFVVSSIEIPIKASTGVAEPFLVTDTSMTHRIMAVGKYHDDSFGTTESTGYCGLVFSGDTIEIPATAVYKKTEISILAKSFFGTGPVYQDQTIYVHELQDTVDRKNYSSTFYPYGETALGQIQMDIDTSYLISNKSYSGSLSDEFGERIFNAAKQDIITNFNLNDYAKGLAFKADINNDLIFQIDPNFLESNVTIKYTDGSSEDSLVFFFTRRPTYSIERNFTGTELDGLSENMPSDLTQNIYLNSVNGAFMGLDLTAVQALRDSLGPMVINTAELYFEDAFVDSLYRVSSGITLNAYEATPDFDFARQSFFKTVNSGNEFFTGVNLSQYRFSMSISRDQDNLNNAFVYVTSTVANQYTPSSGRGPAFIDFIQAIVATNSKVENAKYYLFLNTYGKSFQQIRFKKDKIRLKLYFSYLRNNI